MIQPRRAAGIGRERLLSKLRTPRRPQRHSSCACVTASTRRAGCSTRRNPPFPVPPMSPRAGSACGKGGREEDLRPEGDPASRRSMSRHPGINHRERPPADKAEVRQRPAMSMRAPPARWPWHPHRMPRPGLRVTRKILSWPVIRSAGVAARWQLELHRNPYRNTRIHHLFGAKCHDPEEHSTGQGRPPIPLARRARTRPATPEAEIADTADLHGAGKNGASGKNAAGRGGRPSRTSTAKAADAVADSLPRKWPMERKKWHA